VSSVVIPERARQATSAGERAARSSRTWWLGFAIYLTVILAIVVAAYLGELPSPPSVFPRRIDMLGHFILIGGLAFFLDGALSFRPLFRQRAPWLRLAPTLVLAVAGLEELAQGLSPNRSMSFYDFVGDFLGVLFFSWLAMKLESRLAARSLRSIG
jgi:VanZ family protein